MGTTAVAVLGSASSDFHFFSRNFPHFFLLLSWAPIEIFSQYHAMVYCDTETNFIQFPEEYVKQIFGIFDASQPISENFTHNSPRAQGVCQPQQKSQTGFLAKIKLPLTKNFHGLAFFFLIFFPAKIPVIYVNIADSTIFGIWDKKFSHKKNFFGKNFHRKHDFF